MKIAKLLLLLARGGGTPNSPREKKIEAVEENSLRVGIFACAIYLLSSRITEYCYKLYLL